MAFIHGKNTAISIGATDYSGFISDSTFSTSTDSHDVTVYGDDGHTYILGLTDGTFSCSGHFDNGATGTPAVDFPAFGTTAQTILVQPEGVGTGLSQRSFSAFLTSYEESMPVDDKTSWSADFQISGDVTVTDQA